MDWTVFFYMLGLGAAGFILYSNIKNKPELFTQANFLKTSKVLGVLALCLIGFIALVINLL